MLQFNKKGVRSPCSFVSDLRPDGRLPAVPQEPDNVLDSLEKRKRDEMVQLERGFLHGRVPNNQHSPVGEDGVLVCCITLVVRHTGVS